MGALMSKTSFALKQYENVTYTDFSGGYNIKDAAHLVKNNQCIKGSQNAEYTDIGTIQKRKGIERYNVTRIAASKIEAAYRFYKDDGTKKLLVICNGGLYVGNDLTGTFSLIKSGLAADSIYGFETWKGFCFIGDGVNNNLKYDGTSVTRMGLSTPSSAPTAADSGVAGNLNGIYTYKITFISATSESEPSAESNEVNVVNKQVNLTNIPISSDPECTGRNIYRSGGTIAQYLLVTTINNNTETTYTDNTADADLGLVTLETGNTPPPPLKYFVEHNDYLFGAGDPNNPSYVYFSKKSEPEKWPATYYTPCKSKEGDDITGLIKIGNTVFIFKTSSVWRLEGTSPINFTAKVIHPTVGNIAPKSLVNFGTHAMFLGNDFDVYLFDGVAFVPVGRNIAPILDGTYPYLGMNLDYRDKVAAGGYKKKYFLSYPARDSTTNNYTLFFDLTIAAWSPPWTGVAGAISCYCSFSGKGDKGELYVGDYYGRTGKIDTNDSFDRFPIEDADANTESPIDFKYKTKYFAVFDDMPLLLNDKTFRKIFANVSSSNATMKLGYDLDYGRLSGEGDSEFLASSIWGSVTWGQFVWGAGVLKLIEMALAQGIVGKYMAVVVNNNDKYPLKVNSITIRARLRELH